MDGNEITLDEIYRLLGEKDIVIFRLQREITRSQEAEKDDPIDPSERLREIKKGA
jgi:hypothetical protein